MEREGRAARSGRHGPMASTSDDLTLNGGEALAGGALSFREGMSRVAGAVHIVTTDGRAGRAGFTATSVAPVTDAPPTLLVCANAGGRSGPMLQVNAAFCVNTLGADDAGLAELFAARTGLAGEDRFLTGAWGRLATGAPVLQTSLVSFDCRLVETRRLGTHDVIIGEVAAVRIGPGQPALLYLGRHYRSL